MEPRASRPGPMPPSWRGSPSRPYSSGLTTGDDLEEVPSPPAPLPTVGEGSRRIVAPSPAHRAVGASAQPMFAPRSGGPHGTEGTDGRASSERPGRESGGLPGRRD